MWGNRSHSSGGGFGAFGSRGSHHSVNQTNGFGGGHQNTVEWARHELEADIRKRMGSQHAGGFGGNGGWGTGGGFNEGGGFNQGGGFSQGGGFNQGGGAYQGGGHGFGGGIINRLGNLVGNRLRSIADVVSPRGPR